MRCLLQLKPVSGAAVCMGWEVLMDEARIAEAKVDEVRVDEAEEREWPSVFEDDTIILAKIASIQEKLIRQYRISPQFRETYGNYLLSKWPEGAGVRMAVEAIQKFKGLETVDLEEHRELIIDLMYTRNVLGFAHWEFFSYGMEGKSIEEWLEYMPQRNIMIYYKAMNVDRAAEHKLGNKWLTYQAFEAFFKRDIIRVRTAEDMLPLYTFCQKHRRFIIKPVGGAVGRGISIVDCDDYAGVDEMFEALRDRMPYLCEELIEQDERFEAIHAASVNSLRLFTYCNKSGPKVVCAWLKAGQKDAIVDNGSAGGVVAAIDVERGVVCANASDENANIYETHPDSGFVFNGFEIPRWKECLEMVKVLASAIPAVPLVGWDVVLTKDRGWCIIEGNEWGMINVIQVSSKKGCRREFQEAFEWKKYARRQAKG